VVAVGDAAKVGKADMRLNERPAHRVSTPTLTVTIDGDVWAEQAGQSNSPWRSDTFLFLCLLWRDPAGVADSRLPTGGQSTPAVVEEAIASGLVIDSNRRLRAFLRRRIAPTARYRIGGAAVHGGTLASRTRP